MAAELSTEERLARHLRAMSAELSAARTREQSRHEPIAIVGVGCRYPGGISSAEQLWELVSDQRDAIAELPVNRGWDLAGRYSADPDTPGHSYATTGGFLADADRFDAEFFDISPREAATLDPQQRLLLEAAWEAVENAGLDPRSLRDAQVGVFAGSNIQDYSQVLAAAPIAAEGYVVTGTTGAMISGRLSYVLGLRGPSETIDTACSSSLVALHRAVQALRDRECVAALAGGATVLTTPRAFSEFSRQRALSPDGRCKAFAATADGFGLGEGAGLLYLERLSDAQRLGHPVLAVIRGSAVNSDGASNGITAPNGPSQERVIRDALTAAGVSAAEIDLVEAHGTGTRLGDPIEARALLAVYGPAHEPTRPLWIGSVKSNLGHSQAAAGVAGVIKAVMALQHRILPPTLHVQELTSEVDWSAGTVLPLTEARAWPVEDRPRRAAVSAFGISGTNAHLILEEAPAPSPVGEIPEPPLVPWLLSARSEQALQDQAARLHAWLTDRPEVSAAAVGCSLAHSRSHFEQRTVVLEPSLEALAAVATGQEHGDVVRPQVASPGRTAILFSGQGSQRPGMGHELHAAYPVFAAAFDAVCDEFDRHLRRPLRDVLDTPEVHTTEFAQPALFAVEVALFALVTSWGVRPDRLLGHSIGELVAAHVAGVLTLSDACRIVAARGRLMQELPAGGAMLAVEASEDEVSADGIAADGIAAVNGPRSVVLSGDEEFIAQQAEQWRAQGRRVKRLEVSHAFHSARMEPMLAAFGAVTASASYAEPRIPIVSDVTGRLATAAELADPAYWVEHVRRAVRFHDGLTTLRADGVTTFLELGPDAALTPLAGADCVAGLRRDRPEPRALLTALATLHCRGVEVDWTAVLPGPAPVLGLPTYAFQRRRFWMDPENPPAQGPADLPRYAVVWRPLPATPAPALTGTWLLAGDDPTGVAAALSGSGAEVLTLPAGAGTDRAGLVKLLGEAALPALSGIVSTLGLLPGEPDETLAGTLALIQALGDHGVGAPLWCLACDDTPAAAAVQGLGRVAALEIPERWGGVLQIASDAGATIDLAPALATALSGHTEDQIAIRADGLHVRRVVALPARPTAAAPQLPGTVLITGGTGGLGAEVAVALAEAGAAHLLLLNRSGPDSAAATRLRDRLTRHGTGVTIQACDVSDRTALADVLAAIPPDRPLSGVFHIAGVLDDGVLDALTPQRLATVLAAKTGAARHLHEFTRDLDLDAFVVFSSLSGVLGNAGQGNYAAANALLDDLARRRHADGLSATAVAWGPWASAGMAGGIDTDRLRGSGLTPMPPDRALGALWQAMAAGESAVLVADVNWDAYATRVAATRAHPELAELTGLAAGRPPERPDLAALPPAQRRQRLSDLLNEHLALVLGHGGGWRPDTERSFQELGFDSLTAVELRNRLDAALGLSLPATLVFDYPNLGALRTYLETLVGEENADPGSALAQIDRLAATLGAVQLDDAARGPIEVRLRQLLQEFSAEPARSGTAQPLNDASVDEVLDFITGELGISLQDGHDPHGR
ncbi:type I polyketide synthase [Actinoplanes sp. TFC3]|uniref:type I polyketide synthase n=1 Tax=Actinoplanes sp. TFC3 TaxID=1710355 RepID=UPI00082CD016|nr:type I polyketide synthase [Actinoplanes sp. TFC3]